MRDHSTFDKDFWKYFGCFIGIIVLICFLPWAFTSYSLLNFTDKGPIGDTIGGIMSPFVAIAAAGLTFIAFWVQYKANIQQRHDIAIERFESNLFEMIHIQQEITNGLRYDGGDYNHNEIHKTGRDTFQSLYEKIAIRPKIKDTVQTLTLKRALEISDDVKFTLRFLPELWVLDHYYRHLYRIFKYIDDGDSQIIVDNRKYEYAAIVRATLSPYELIMLYYNGFSHPKFKELIERYALLNNIRYPLLATSADANLIKEKFKDEYPPSKDEGKDMTREYKKGAFVYAKRNTK